MNEQQKIAEDYAHLEERDQRAEEEHLSITPWFHISIFNDANERKESVHVCADTAEKTQFHAPPM